MEGAMLSDNSAREALRDFCDGQIGPRITRMRRMEKIPNIVFADPIRDIRVIRGLIPCSACG
jgi:hypothetical protein